MKKLGTYCGATLLNETNMENKVMLEYYGSKKRYIDKIKLKTYYGITVVKKEYGKNAIKSETNSVNRISTSQSKIKDIIEILRRNKVTPIGLNDVLAELLPQQNV